MVSSWKSAGLFLWAMGRCVIREYVIMNKDVCFSAIYVDKVANGWTSVKKRIIYSVSYC